MAFKILETKRIWRYACAVLASFVTTFIAVMSSPFAAAQTCSWQDAASWQLAISEPQVEATPEYILNVTETFIAACPERPEVAEARRIAGIAAADEGLAKRATEHFSAAGPMTDAQSNFYAISAYLAAGDKQAAWDTRDKYVETWLRQIKRSGHVSVETRQVRGGHIHSVLFGKKNKESGIGAAWVAIPDGPGWPATLTFSAERQRLAFQKIRGGQVPEDLRHIDLYRCHGRRLMAERDASSSAGQLDLSAEIALEAYLARPDQYQKGNAGDPLTVCLWPGRLFPKP